MSGDRRRSWATGALLALASWARAARNPVPPLAIAMSFGLWLLRARRRARRAPDADVTI